MGGADKDVMLKLKKLSVQASDEEEEPGKTDSKSEKECAVLFGNLTLSPLNCCPQSSPPVKATRRIRFVSTFTVQGCRVCAHMLEALKRSDSESLTKMSRK